MKTFPTSFLLSLGEALVAARQGAYFSVVRSLFSDFDKGDFNAILSKCSENVVFQQAGNPEFMPWAGTYQGKPEVAGFFDVLAAHLRVITLRPENPRFKGNELVLDLYMKARSIATGKECEVTHADLHFIFENGKLVRFDGCGDFSALEKAMQPYEMQ